MQDLARYMYRFSNANTDQQRTHTHTKHLADKICVGRIYSNTMCTLYTSYSYNTLLASIWLNNQGEPCIDTNNIGDLCSKTHAKTVPDVKHKSRVLCKMTARKTPGIQKNHATSAMLSQQKGSYPTRPKYLLFAAKLWNKFVDICCQHVQKGCGLLLPKLKANMWTICCQNARICGLFAVKIDNKYVDNLLPKCQKICGLLLQNGKKMRGY